MEKYYVYYYREKAKVEDLRIFTTLEELEDWLWRIKELNDETVTIRNIISSSRLFPHL